MKVDSAIRTGLRLMLLTALFAALTACATVQMGQDFDLQAFKSQVVRGRTTQAQIQQWLGSPKSTGIAVDTNGQKFDQWTYFYGKGKLNRMKQARLKILQVKFDQEGIVRGYNYSTEVK